MTALIDSLLMRALAAAGSLRVRLGEERGQGLMEYAMLSGLIAVAIAGVGALVLTGAIETLFQNVANCISGTGTCFGS